MMKTKQNQQNPPLPKKERVDSVGNDARRVFAKVYNNKGGNATLQLCKVPTENAAKVFIESMKTWCDNVHGSLNCNLFYTK